MLSVSCGLEAVHLKLKCGWGVSMSSVILMGVVLGV